MYKDARKWKAEIQEKPMKIYNYEIIEYNFPYLKVSFSVWSWTYIRSIGYWLWQELNLWWALITLERTWIGNTKLSDLWDKEFAKGNIKGAERTIYYKEIEI
jgi:tRNA U55 pseudouridine synthase TruB